MQSSRSQFKSMSGVAVAKERLIHAILLISALISVVTTVSIVAVLVSESLGFFREVSVKDFLTDSKWTPLFEPKHFGILPLVCGTMLVAAGAASVAVPVGLATAVFLSEYAGPRLRGTVKPLLEVLAGIPSVVYGYFAIVTVSPIVRNFVQWLNDTALINGSLEADVFNAANASIVVGIMILPMVVSLSADVLSAVPRSLREAAFALGSTKFDVTVRVVVPAGLSGIVASFLLAISRAIGETMAVTMAAGATPTMTLNPLQSVQTMTAYIVQVSLGDTPRGSIEYRSIFAVGMTLFMMTLIINVFSQWILTKYREKYD